MKAYKYLIVGGGMTADAAVRGIRELDPEGSIGLVGAEPHPPYNRPPLSKGLWKGGEVDSVFRHNEAQRLETHLGRRVLKLDLGHLEASDDQNQTYRFQKLLLATGGTPRHFPFAGDQVIYFRTLEDYQRLRGMAGEGKRLVVIGGGFIGSEIAAALCTVGSEVTLLFPEEGIGWRLYPGDLARFLVDFYREKGVEVRPGTKVVGIQDGRVQLEGGEVLQADGIVAGIGIRPNLELAEAAGLEVQDGIVVDEFGQTRHPAVFAAGDVARFPNPLLGPMRVEHEDHANSHGHQVGRNLAGARQPYQHLPFFYSDLFELGYEAVGHLDSRLQMLSDWKQPYREGVVYYLDQGRVRGVLLWNTWGQVDQARALIAEPGPFEPKDLKGRI